jgi:hypothetical protein
MLSFVSDCVCVLAELLCEIADERGQVEASEEELAELMAARFNDPAEHAFGGDK